VGSTGTLCERIVHVATHVRWRDSPFCLGVALVSLLVVLLSSSAALGGSFRDEFFRVPREAAFSLGDPLCWARVLLTHVFGHVGWSHLSSNLSLFLLLGPHLESVYGAARLAAFVAASTAVCGAMACAMGEAACGSANIVLMFVVVHAVHLACRAEEDTRLGEGIPLTYVLTVVVYITKEVVGAFYFSAAEVAVGAGGLPFDDAGATHVSHLVGGLVGALLALNASPSGRTPLGFMTADGYLSDGCLSDG